MVAANPWASLEASRARGATTVVALGVRAEEPEARAVVLGAREAWVDQAEGSAAQGAGAVARVERPGPGTLSRPLR